MVNTVNCVHKPQSVDFWHHIAAWKAWGSQDFDSVLESAACTMKCIDTPSSNLPMWGGAQAQWTRRLCVGKEIVRLYSFGIWTLGIASTLQDSMACGDILVLPSECVRSEVQVAELWICWYCFGAVHEIAEVAAELWGNKNLWECQLAVGNGCKDQLVSHGVVHDSVWDLVWFK